MNDNSNLPPDVPPSLISLIPTALNKEHVVSLLSELKLINLSLEELGKILYVDFESGDLSKSTLTTGLALFSQQVNENNKDNLFHIGPYLKTSFDMVKNTPVAYKDMLPLVGAWVDGLLRLVIVNAHHFDKTKQQQRQTKEDEDVSTTKKQQVVPYRKNQTLLNHLREIYGFCQVAKTAEIKLQEILRSIVQKEKENTSS
jgi:hypothetical protein